MLYGEIAKQVCTSIPAVQGFYLWGYYDKNGLWRNVYLGKAGFGKTANLRARILHELKTERVFVWRQRMSDSELETRLERIRGHMWLLYNKHFIRSLKKRGTTHIAWVADGNLSNDQVGEVESDLIETLNPVANVMRPIPPKHLQEHTEGIIADLRDQIHRSRPTFWRYAGSVS